MLRIARKLRQIGVLGINRRNAEYTLWYNPRKYYPLVDDKLATKELAQKAGIKVPELYAVVELAGQVKRLHQRLDRYADFVIKPAHGSGGEGILVIAGRTGGRYRTVGGQLLEKEDLNHHLFNLLSGLYSLSGQPDMAIVEYRVKVAPVFESISFQGVPDIRIIVFLGVPVMAMVRLPTRMSQGKANLHQGAIGAGVDLATGRTLNAVWRNAIVSEHPDTNQGVAGVAIPGWRELLELAASACGLTGLGYVGVDIVLDKDKGPLILEMNARPGLNIQIANRAGLLARLETVKRSIEKLPSLGDRVAFSRERFAAAA